MQGVTFAAMMIVSVWTSGVHSSLDIYGPAELAVSATSSATVPPTQNVSCHSLQLVESNMHCGDKGYIMGFAYKYCMKFQDPETASSFGSSNSSGAVWLTNVSRCLVNDVVKYYNDAGGHTNCSSIEEHGWDSLTDCFAKSGFCNMCKEDKKALILSMLPDILKPEVLEALVKVVIQCGPTFCGLVDNKCLTAVYDVYNNCIK